MAAPITLDTDTLRMVDRLAELSNARAAIEEQEEALKAELRLRLKPGQVGVDQTGAERIKLVRNARFSPEIAETVVPVAILELARVTTVDGKKLKELVSPALYAQCQAIGAPKVVLV